MRTTAIHSYQARRPGLLHDPIRSVPLFQPVHRVLGWSEAEKATFALAVARNNLASAELGYAGARTILGNANRAPIGMRRHYQSKAFRNLNSQRAGLRAARKAVAAAEVAALALNLPLAG